MKRTLQIACLTFAFIALSATAVHAKGHVLQVVGDKIYIDLGAAHGVGTGTKLGLLHAIEAQDPVTKKKLRDTFPIGTLTVVKTGAKLCLARAPKKLLHRVRVGDEVAIGSPRRVFVDPWREHIRRQKQLPGLADAKLRQRAARSQAMAKIQSAKQTRAAWKQTLNKPPSEAIAIWRAYLLTHPRSHYQTYVNRELSKLEALKSREKQLRDTEPGTDDRRDLRTVRLAALFGGQALDRTLALKPPKQLYTGVPVALAFTVLRPDKVGTAWLYYRTRGDRSFHRTALKRDGDNYLRATITTYQVRAPGIEMFVEALPPQGGKPSSVWASENLPHSIAVAPRIEQKAPSRVNRSRVTLFMDYVDFDGNQNNGFDQYLHAEVDFMYRFYSPVYAMRVGFGTLSGVGGPKDVIDDDPNGCLDSQSRYRCRRVSFNYAYTELEFRYSNMLAFMIRPQFGSGTSDNLPGTDAGRCDGSDTTGCDIFNAFGLRARIRVGEDTATNLTLGIGVTEKVGALFEAAFTWDVIPKFPIVLTAQVTDQPVIENFGVRLIGDIGWRAVDWVYPSLRLAFQARDVDHDGFSAGLAMNFDW